MEKKIQGSKVNGKFVGASETWLLRHHIYAPTDGIRIMEHFFFYFSSWFGFGWSDVPDLVIHACMPAPLLASFLTVRSMSKNPARSNVRKTVRSSRKQFNSS